MVCVDVGTVGAPPEVAHPAATKSVTAAMAVRWVIELLTGKPLGLCNLRTLAEQEQRAANLDPITAFQGMPSAHRLSIHQHLSPSGRADEIVAAFLADDRVMSLHGLVTKQSNIAFLGPADDGNRFAQGIFATLARVTALRTHHHQPSAFQQLADQPDKESDQGAKHDNRDRAAERLRKRRGQ